MELLQQIKDFLIPELDAIRQEQSAIRERLNSIDLHLVDQSRRIDESNKRIDETNKRIDETNKCDRKGHPLSVALPQKGTSTLCASFPPVRTRKGHPLSASTEKDTHFPDTETTEKNKERDTHFGCGFARKRTEQNIQKRTPTFCSSPSAPTPNAQSRKRTPTFCWLCFPKENTKKDTHKDHRKGHPLSVQKRTPTFCSPTPQKRTPTEKDTHFPALCEAPM